MVQIVEVQVLSRPRFFLKPPNGGFLLLSRMVKNHEVVSLSLVELAIKQAQSRQFR